MDGFIKHVHWEYADMKGVCGVGIIFDRLKIEKLDGHDLPVAILLPVLNVVLGDGWEKEMEKFHLRRKNPWHVEEHKGMSGAKDYCLRVILNGKWRYAPIVAHFHVSMNDKLNEGMNLWLGDVPPLLAKVLQDYSVEKPDELRVYSPKAIWGGDYTFPSKPSGFLETIESIKVLESLGGDGDNA